MPAVDPRNTEGMYMMLGEMRADLKYLVAERSIHGARLDAIDQATDQRISQVNARLTALETFKTQIGMVTVGLGVLVPTALTIFARKLGFL